MRVYATEPPWSGSSEFGSWRRGRDLWDGSTEWTLVPYSPRATLTVLSNILKNLYMPLVVEQLNSEFLIEVMPGRGLPSTSRTSPAMTKWSSVCSFLREIFSSSRTTSRSSRD